MIFGLVWGLNHRSKVQGGRQALARARPRVLSCWIGWTCWWKCSTNTWPTRIFAKKTLWRGTEQSKSLFMWRPHTSTDRTGISFKIRDRTIHWNTEGTVMRSTDKACEILKNAVECPWHLVSFQGHRRSMFLRTRVRHLVPPLIPRVAWPLWRIRS